MILLSCAGLDMRKAQDCLHDVSDEASWQESVTNCKVWLLILNVDLDVLVFFRYVYGGVRSLHLGERMPR